MPRRRRPGNSSAASRSSEGLPVAIMGLPEHGPSRHWRKFVSNAAVGRRSAVVRAGAALICSILSGRAPANALPRGRSARCWKPRNRRNRHRRHGCGSPWSMIDCNPLLPKPACSRAVTLRHSAAPAPPSPRISWLRQAVGSESRRPECPTYKWRPCARLDDASHFARRFRRVAQEGDDESIDAASKLSSANGKACASPMRNCACVVAGRVRANLIWPSDGSMPVNRCGRSARNQHFR